VWSKHERDIPGSGLTPLGMDKESAYQYKSTLFFDDEIVRNV
jgi:hypothetical protein